MVVLGLASCVPPNPGPTGLYLGIQPSIHPSVTPKASPVTWGSAPAIDEHYGATLYTGTSIEQPDPRPPLVNGDEPLRLWVANPDNGVKDRPAIVWLHGGGFAVGIDSMYGLANGTAKEYAARGYVGFSVEYRTDTTLIGATTGSGRPASLCQWVQDHESPGDPTWEARRAQCKRNIIAAQRDVQAAVRWIRNHAASYDVDPGKIAVGGFSAGAVTAINLAYRSDDVGSTPYFAGDGLSVPRSRIQGALAASGCLYPDEPGAPLTDIGAGDAPISGIHSSGDGAVPYACAAATVNTARSQGLVAELTSYCGESGHAADLYDQHKAATDDQWTTFLARQLNLYTGMREPTAAPTC
ncbi:MAG: alpha/beta hydrolase [Actinomycetota bacterium]|nr:alpha/beta hydrolase [Actinomycetota bacterium]